MHLEISVIVPTYNRAKFLPDCIRSLLNQTIKLKKIIVVDDGSNDNTKSVIREFSDVVTYIFQENAGKSAAIQNGLNYVNSDLIWIFDDDDIACPDAAERHAEALLHNANAAFSFGSCYVFQDEGARDTRKAKINQAPDLNGRAVFRRFLASNFVNQQAVVVRSEAFRSIGYNTKFRRSQDYDFALRLSARFDGVHIEGPPVYWLRRHNGPRGAGIHEHAAKEAMMRWLENDRSIFEDFLPKLEWSQIVGSSQQDLTRRKDNQSMLNIYRVAIAIRHRLIAEAKTYAGTKQVDHDTTSTHDDLRQLRTFLNLIFYHDAYLVALLHDRAFSKFLLEELPVTPSSRPVLLFLSKAFIRRAYVQGKAFHSKNAGMAALAALKIATRAIL